ncbi:hypothetical protein GTQ99_17065 [Kineococcus sp. T13]|uniref:hypothetical protein n=1 Tax=Kineococcus vitellinus TaxID=2696565 RepID=UPI00141327B4|nr:hypothetical protein [Kineococcus vitellinus]NAZ77118.1 hypothetical protein [Kineococcus vitellinus]
MADDQHFVLATVVTRTAWESGSHQVLASSRAVLDEQMRRCGLLVRDRPREEVELLPGGTRVRITLSVDAVPPPGAPAAPGAPAPGTP